MDLVDVVAEYMNRVQAVYATGVTTEHSFRVALGYLFDNIADDVTAINEPKGIKVGRPDFAFTRKVGHNNITIGHCEAKDIDKDVNPRAMKDANKNQFDRYIKGLPNLIYTNGLDFRFYVKGEFVREISIADFLIGITPKKRNYHALAQALKEFAAERVQTITSAKRLAELMAGKAVLIKTVLGNSLKDDIELNTELVGQYKAFKEQLIHDLTPDGFADIYAETVAYGMFAARLHDETLEDFSREEALELLPKSNPFLRNLFSYVAGPTLDERIKRDINELAEIFQATDLQKLFEDFGHFTKRNDPFIHFYETFLAEYNPKKRKARGVWYTPEPVVNFIVRAVDDVLKTEFGLPMGLADTSKITVDVDTGQTKTVKGKAKPIIEKREMHRVQILDPATGTGTFLAEVIKQIAPKIKGVAPGQWSSYVEKEMIPRIHGFELLMASYAMCHMKLDMMLKEMDYVPTDKPPRLSVYLTNSLEEGDKEVRELSNEAKAANEVKRDKPIMCIIGNPPYSGISQNMGDWITDLIEAYKYVDGKHINERKHWLHDDYVKFIRLSESMIEKNGEGILAFITNHGYLDNPTFRGMRWHLLKTFDKIHVLDLHGNSKKTNTSPDGETDKNVFDIQQGVAIIVATKSKPPNTKIAKVLHQDLWGKRQSKYDALWNGSLKAKQWNEVILRPPFYTLAPTQENSDTYQKGFSLKDTFPLQSTTVITARDSVVIDFNHRDLVGKISEFSDVNNSTDFLRNKFFGSRKDGKYAKGDTRGWKLESARQELVDLTISDQIVSYSYRPFDTRNIFYHDSMVDWSRRDVMQNLQNDNFAMVFCRQLSVSNWTHVLIADKILDDCFVSNRSKERGYAAPLYLYPEEGDLDQSRRVNMDSKIRAAIEKAATDKRGVPDEVAIFDYIYGVLHCPAYRETYAEFLKIDFPRIPYPPSPDVFWDVSAKGTELRKLHLMEPDAIGPAPYPFEGQGDSVVEKLSFVETDNGLGVVRINKHQHFTHVPKIAWEFYIGGYQPAQKWLKDRKGRTLEFADIQHYQNIIKILTETDRIMKTIEMDLG